MKRIYKRQLQAYSRMAQVIDKASDTFICVITALTLIGGIFLFG